MNPFPLPLT